MIRRNHVVKLASVIAIHAVFSAWASAAPTISLGLAPGGSDRVAPGNKILVDISLTQTTVTPNQDLINDGVGNFGFTLGLSNPIGSITGFTYATGFEPDSFLIPDLPSVLGQSTSTTPPLVTKATSNTLLLGTIEITLDPAAASGSQTMLTVNDFSGGANFRFGNGALGNVDTMILANVPIFQVTAVPEPGIVSNMALGLLALLCRSRIMSFRKRG